MMIKPGITELSRCVDSRYTLVSMASKRARMIGEHTVEENGVFTSIKPVSIAASEISEGKVGYVRSDAIKEAEQYEAEKEAAILQYAENTIEEALNSFDNDSSEEYADLPQGEEYADYSEEASEDEALFKENDEKKFEKKNAFDFLNVPMDKENE